MTYYFLESSAFAKLFVMEQGSASLIRLMEQVDDARKLISALASLEVRSAIRRRQRAGEILPSEADAALDDVSAEVLRIVEQPLIPSVIEVARSLLEKHNLRTLDALHLSASVVMRDTLQASDMYFVSSDNLLLKAAELEQFQTLDPLQM